MTKTSKTIIFFGNERLATGVSTTTPALQALINAGYNVAAVVSNYEKATSRSNRELEVADIARQHNIPLLLPNKPAEIIDQLKDYRADAGVLAAYGRIVPQSVIDIFPKGIINVHPSLLPLHRGPTPLESVILDGAPKTGVSIMALAKEMDAGPVYGQSEVELRGNETKQALADTLSEVGATMLIELLPGILDGSVVAVPQDDSRATYDRLLTKQDGVIDWNKPAIQLEREIRAFAGWPGSRTTLATKEVVVMATTITSVDDLTPGQATVIDKDLIVGCSDGALRIDRLKPAGKAEMTGQAFLAGYKHLL